MSFLIGPLDEWLAHETGKEVLWIGRVWVRTGKTLVSAKGKEQKPIVAKGLGILISNTKRHLNLSIFSYPIQDERKMIMYLIDIKIKTITQQGFAIFSA